MLTDQEKKQLNVISIWKQVSFPNGSNYRQQYLPSNLVGGIYNGIKVRWSPGVGYFVTFPGEGETVKKVSFNRSNVGPGIDLGIHFCSVDQGLSDLK